ncbi:MAG: nitrite reductase/ring-hydroxylating ferredoxin subunit [Paracoccaceae bacterium]|jgi:nitrite reductase/ring-hydroxylating ferredoxin subunit
MRYFSLEKLINLHDGYRKNFKIDEHHLLLIQEEGVRFLIESFCPHREHSLIDATVLGGSISCPHHHYQFQLSSGDILQRTEEPCRRLRVYELVEEDRDVGVYL